MKLAIVIERFDPAGGGAERSTAQIAAHLGRRGHDVTVLAWWCNPSAAPETGRIVAHGSSQRCGPLELWRFARWARRRLAAGGFDTSLSVTTAVPAAVLQPRGGTVRETLLRNAAMRVTAGGRLAKRLLDALRPKRRVALYLERRTLADPAVRRIVALSGYVADQLARHYGIRDNVEILANGAEMPAPDARQARAWRMAVRRGFGIGADTPVFLFAAHNPRLKGADTLLAAMARLAERRVEAVLLVAGPLAYRLQHLAASLGVRGDVRFTGPTRCMPALYCAADVTVLPTYYDPASKVVLESLLMGRPAITTVYNGAADLLQDAGRSGPAGRVLADPADVGALAEVMAELADPRVREACRPSPGLMAGRLTIARHVDRLEQVLREAADGFADRPGPGL